MVQGRHNTANEQLTGAAPYSCRNMAGWPSNIFSKTQI